MFYSICLNSSSVPVGRLIKLSFVFAFPPPSTGSSIPFISLWSLFLLMNPGSGSSSYSRTVPPTGITPCAATARRVVQPRHTTSVFVCTQTASCSVQRSLDFLSGRLILTKGDNAVVGRLVFVDILHDEACLVLVVQGHEEIVIILPPNLDRAKAGEEVHYRLGGGVLSTAHVEYVVPRRSHYEKQTKSLKDQSTKNKKCIEVHLQSVPEMLR